MRILGGVGWEGRVKTCGDKQYLEEIEREETEKDERISCQRKLKMHQPQYLNSNHEQNSILQPKCY